LDEDLLERLFGDEVRAGLITHSLDISGLWKNRYSTSTNHKVWAAKFTARHPNLVALEVSSFKCGHDAPIYGVIEGIIENSGNPYFSSKDLDENKPTGFIRIRVKTIDYFLRRYREDVYASNEELATEQVKIEEHQRVLGFIPNFYVSYDKNPVPLTSRLKFRLAFKVAIDPVTFAGTGFLAAEGQSSHYPNYAEGMEGYGKRFGSVYVNGLTDILIGGAFLPSILHQDPRYFYQGTGSTKSRMRHALLSSVICKGDNGKWQPNYSSLGGTWPQEQSLTHITPGRIVGQLCSPESSLLISAPMSRMGIFRDLS